MRRYRPWRQVGLKSTTSRRVYTPRCWFGYPKATPESGSKIVRRFSQPLVRSGPFGNVLRKCQQGKGLSQEQLDGRGNRSRRLLTARPLDYLQETPCQFANPIQFTTPDRLPIDQIRPIPTAAASTHSTLCRPTTLAWWPKGRASRKRKLPRSSSFRSSPTPSTCNCNWATSSRRSPSPDRRPRCSTREPRR